MRMVNIKKTWIPSFYFSSYYFYLVNNHFRHLLRALAHRDMGSNPCLQGLIV